MKRIKRILSCAIVLVAITGLYGVGSASVSLYDPTWEAPGGYLQVPSGISSAHTGGKTWNYSNFDSTAYAALYYVIGDYDYDPGPPEVWTFNPAGPSIGTSINGMTRLHYDSSASNLSEGKVVWTSPIDIYDAATSSNQTYDARFTLSVYDGSGNPVSLIDASTLTGMDARVGGTHQIQGDFIANWLFELSNPGIANWNAAVPFFDGLNTDPSDSLQSSVTRAFYYTPVPNDCPGDFDTDGDVDGSDLAVFAADFGRTDCSGDCEGDFDGDGDVDGSDLAVFAADFGRTDCIE
jgi:hypothetical protein